MIILIPMVTTTKIPFQQRIWAELLSHLCQVRTSLFFSFFFALFIPYHGPISIGPPKQDRKQRMKIKNNRSLCFHFDFRMCPYIPRTTGQNLYMCTTYIIRLSSLRGLKGCALFVISTSISRIIVENVRKMAKNTSLKMQIYEANDISSCRAWNFEWNGVFCKALPFSDVKYLR